MANSVRFLMISGRSELDLPFIVFLTDASKEAICHTQGERKPAGPNALYTSFQSIPSGGRKIVTVRSGLSTARRSASFAAPLRPARSRSAQMKRCRHRFGGSNFGIYELDIVGQHGMP